MRGFPFPSGGLFFSVSLLIKLREPYLSWPNPLPDDGLFIIQRPSFAVNGYGCFTPPEIRQFLINAATRVAIPTKRTAFTGHSWTTLHLSKGGISTGGICFPRRYAHSPVEVARDFAAKPFKLGATAKRKSASAVMR